MRLGLRLMELYCLFIQPLTCALLRRFEIVCGPYYKVRFDCIYQQICSVAQRESNIPKYVQYKFFPMQCATEIKALSKNVLQTYLDDLTCNERRIRQKCYITFDIRYIQVEGVGDSEGEREGEGRGEG